MRNKAVVASALFGLFGFMGVAQGSVPPPPTPPPPNLPIDLGIVLLFIVGLLYGVYKAYKFSKKTA